MGSRRKAWLETCKRAGVRYRWHDLRHSFATHLAERPEVSEQTIRALAGHVSDLMLQRYSHIRSQAKQAAIRASTAGNSAEFARARAKNRAK